MKTEDLRNPANLPQGEGRPCLRVTDGLNSLAAGLVPSIQRPWISTNLAISADGKISPARRRASGWTSAEDHQRLRDLRRGADALLVGRGTLTADQMTLTRPEDPAMPVAQPLRCVVSRTGVIAPDHPLFSKPGGPIHLLITGESTAATDGWPADVTIHRQSLPEFLATLVTGFGVARLHCEGGGELVASLAALGAIDEFHLTLAGHTLFGGWNAPTATGIPGGFLPKSSEFELTHYAPRPDLGECFLSYRKRPSQAQNA